MSETRYFQLILVRMVNLYYASNSLSSFVLWCFAPNPDYCSACRFENATRPI